MVNNPKYNEWIKNRPPVSPLFTAMFKQMAKNGELEGLTGDDALLKVANATEQMIEEQAAARRH